MCMRSSQQEPMFLRLLLDPMDGVKLPSGSKAVSMFDAAITKEESKHTSFHREYLEPFEYLGPRHHYEKETPLSPVFGDPTMVDTIMSSLELEHILQQPLFFVDQSTNDTHAKLKNLPNACVRRPGTFLNKDGKWIKGKPCRVESCDKRAQSNGLCKGHGGGARCSFQGCNKSSQGGGLCRAHGGGKRCLHKGCQKGTQRNGFCYLHGGVRSCSVEGCDRKDRGNGKCFSHGGGRRCQLPFCGASLRRGTYCQLHT